MTKSNADAKVVSDIHFSVLTEIPGFVVSRVLSAFWLAQSESYSSLELAIKDVRHRMVEAAAKLDGDAVIGVSITPVPTDHPSDHMVMATGAIVTLESLTSSQMFEKRLVDAVARNDDRPVNSPRSRNADLIRTVMADAFRYKNLTESERALLIRFLDVADRIDAQRRTSPRSST